MTHDTQNQPAPQPRIFKIGATTIAADDSLAGLDNEQVRETLKSAYPEVAHATVRERMLDDGTQVIEFLPKLGRKG